MADRASAEALARKLQANGTAPFAGEADAIELLSANARVSGVVPDDDDEELLEDADEEEGGVEEDTDDEPPDDEEVESDDEEDADEESDSDEEEEADGDGDYEEFAYSDDDTIEVQVDGEVEEVSIKALKAAYSGEGAIQKRLKQATEERKAARAERDNAQREIEEHRENLMQTIVKLDQVLFLPMVEKPDVKLRQRNMNQYLIEQDAYNEDQKRIVEMRGAVATYFQQQQQTMAQARQNYRVEQQKMLHEKMPELLDAKRAPIVRSEIMAAANHYGFTAEQVATVDNHGLFLMARDAARWLNLQKIKQNGNGKSVPTGGELKVRRRLKGGGTASTKARVQSQSKAKANAAKVARQTGSVDDVTNYLIAGARNAAKERGRRFKKV